MESGNNNNWTLGSLLGRYTRTQVLAEVSQARYRLAIQNLAIHLAGKTAHPDDVDLSRVTVDLLLDYRDACMRRMKAISWNTERRHISVILNFGIRIGALDKNPFRFVPRSPVPQGLPKAVAQPDLQAYLSLLRTGYKTDRLGRRRDLIDPQWFWLAVVQTFYYTGMRKRQLVGLIWDDINFRDKTIRLRAETSKNRREWEIPLADDLLPYLTDLREKTVQLKGHDLRGAQVFCLPLFSERVYASKTMKPDNIQVFFNRLRAHMPRDMPPLTAHRIRHTTSTILANNAPNLRLVQQQLGHASIVTTMGYVHPDMAAMRAAVECLTPKKAVPERDV